MTILNGIFHDSYDYITSHLRLIASVRCIRLTVDNHYHSHHIMSSSTPITLLEIDYPIQWQSSNSTSAKFCYRTYLPLHECMCVYTNQSRLGNTMQAKCHIAWTVYGEQHANVEGIILSMKQKQNIFCAVCQYKKKSILLNENQDIGMRKTGQFCSVENKFS